MWIIIWNACKKYFINIGAKKKLFTFWLRNILCSRGSAPLSPRFAGGFVNPYSPPGAPCQGLGSFWIESPKPTGYRVSLVSVSESGSQNFQILGKNPKKFHTNRYTTNVEYKIDHISKTKIITKNGVGLKNLFQNIEHLLGWIFILAN